MNRSSSFSPKDIESVEISCFNIKGRKFYFRTDWKQDSFTVEATDGRQMWSSVVTRDLLIGSLCPKHMELKEYLTLVRQTLQNEHQYGTVSLSQATDPNQAKLTWRIKVKDQNFESLGQEVSLRGVILLDKLVDDRTKHFQNFLDMLITQVYFFKEENQNLNTRINTLESKNAETNEKFQQLVTDKQGLELDLYTRFALVLNTKKQKIRELEEQINKLKKKGSPRKNSQEKSPKRKSPPPKQKKKVIVDAGSDSDSTDSDILSFGEDSEISDEALPSASLDSSLAKPGSLSPNRQSPERKNPSPVRKTREIYPTLSTTPKDKDSFALFEDSPSSLVKVKVRKRRNRSREPHVNARIPAKNITKQTTRVRSRSPSPDITILSSKTKKRKQFSRAKSPSPKRQKTRNSNPEIIDSLDEISNLLNDVQ